MPLIDVRCENDHVTEANRPLADWPRTPLCAECGAPTVQVMLPPRTTWSIDPVVVYRAPDGSFRFPGADNSLTTRNYDRQGLTRIELRSAADVRRFEGEMNRRELSRAQRRVEARQAGRHVRESMSRSELRRQMTQMSTLGRDLARAAMRHNDGKPLERARDANFHVEALSMDRSNREVSRDAQGRRRRD